MTRLLLHPARGPLRGSVPVPSDKSIGHRALIFAALAHGRSRITGFGYGEDNVATMNAFARMGVSFDDDARGTVICTGVALDGLSAPVAELDCGNSGTTMRLLSGVLAGQHFRARLVGDASLSRRPMGRVAVPLRARGAVVAGTPHESKSGEITAPLEIGPLPESTRLRAFEYEQPIASAQVKSALLLSGLFADGPTLLREPVVSRDHTERMMRALEMPIEAAGSMVSLHPPADPRAIAPFDVMLPGDLSAAAFLLAAGLIVPDSAVTTRATGLNPTRTGALEAIRHFGGQLGFEPKGDALGEPLGDVTATFSALTGTTVGGEVAVRAIDEIPILSALAARARGRTTFVDVGELRVKESDRIASMLGILSAFGVEAGELETGFWVEGRPDGALEACTVASRGDHRIAMTAAVLGLVASGTTTIHDADVIATSFPKFVGTLRALGAEIEVET